MRILYDHQIFRAQKFGGINRYFVELMKLKENGIDVETTHPDLARVKVFSKRMDLFSRGVRYVKRKAGFEEKADKGLFPPETRSKLRKGAFDVFHPTYYNPYFLGFTSKPFVLTVYDMIHEIYKEYFPLWDSTSHNKRVLCSKASQIIAISQKTKEDLLEIFDLPESKVCVIPLASDLDKYTPTRPPQLAGIEKYFLFTGNRWGYKNFYYPILALSELMREDQSLQLLCTGPSFKPEELIFFKDLKIDRQVKHAWFADDRELAWVYRNARFFIFPSLYEGFGVPLLEAFASECPVIASRSGALPEIGENAALYFNPKNSGEIQKAAHTVLSDETVRQTLISNGKKQFSKYSWEECRSKTIEVYEKIGH